MDLGIRDVYHELDNSFFSSIKSRLDTLWSLIYQKPLAQRYLYADRLYILPSDFLAKNNFDDLNTFADQLGVVDTTSIRFLFTQSHSPIDHFAIHVDGYGVEVQNFALNIPLSNVVHSETNYFRITQGKPTAHIKHIGLEGCTLEKMFSIKMKTGVPCLLRTNVPHNVVNSSDGLRVVCGWGIKKELSWQQLPSLIQNNLEDGKRRAFFYGSLYES